MKLEGLTSDQWELIHSHPEKTKQGILRWFKGVPYPCRAYFDGLNDPNFHLRALGALGIVKKFLVNLGYLANLVIPRTFKLKKWEEFLKKITDLCTYPQLDEFLVKDDEWSEPVWEIGKFIKIFLIGIGFNEEICYQFSRVIMCFLEFDQAYRYRLQDLIGETSKQALTRPRREIKRLYRILVARDIFMPGKMWGIFERVEKFVTPLLFILLIPKFRKAFDKAVEAVDLEKIKFNDNDRFHFAFWRGYDFEGKSFEQRFNPYAEIYKNAPYRKKESPQVTANFLLGE